MSPEVLDPSTIPTDVKFVIAHCGSVVEAHKFVLAMGSPVFMKQFYGLLKETDEMVSVKETNKESFAVMIDFLYGKEIDLKTKNVEELFDVANVAEKYHINSLMDAVKKVVEDYPLKEDNVVVCASLALQYDQFEAPSRALLMNCAKFLKSILKTVKDFEAFAEKYSETGLSDVAFKLQGMMSKVPHGCKDCRFGKVITNIDDISKGDKVMFNPESKEPDVNDNLRGKEITVAFIQHGPRGVIDATEAIDGYRNDFYFEYEGSFTFLFCKC